MNNLPTDSSDWINTQAPFLSNFESTLRCHVCKEFFTAPMITQCGHTFCSYCIRTYLSSGHKSACPLCRHAITISSLKKNSAMEETVDHYKNIRPQLIELAQPKQQLTVPIVKEVDQVVDSGISTDRFSDSDGKSDGSIQSNEYVTIDLTSSASPGTEIRRSSRKRKTPDTPGFVNLEAATKLESEALGECPICSKKMKISEIQGSHITKCLSGEATPNNLPTSSFPPAKKPFSRVGISKSSSPFEVGKKLPTLHYSSLNDTKLRDALHKLGLSKHGSRQELERRHVDFLNLWNANCDSKYPVSKSEIMHQLHALERTYDDNSKVQNKKDFDNEGWLHGNKDQFADLIQKARNNIKKKQLEEDSKA